MDVLIKGMKMPKGCITCMFKFESLFNRTMWCEWLDDPLGDYSKCDEKWRHPACPLVEVPPHDGYYGDNHPQIAYRCSNCDEQYIGYPGEFKYCPNCGMKMVNKDG